MESIFCSVFFWKWSLKLNLCHQGVWDSIMVSKLCSLYISFFYSSLTCHRLLLLAWNFFPQGYVLPGTPKSEIWSELLNTRMNPKPNSNKCEARFICWQCIPCSPPRAAHSHSSSVGSLFPFHWQKARASFQLTWTTGKFRRSRIPEPGPAGWGAVGQTN